MTITPSTRSRIWHAAYCRWYDHRKVEHRIRATLWGVASDRICRMFDRIGWGR